MKLKTITLIANLSVLLVTSQSAEIIIEQPSLSDSRVHLINLDQNFSSLNQALSVPKSEEEIKEDLERIQQEQARKDAEDLEKFRKEIEEAELQIKAEEAEMKQKEPQQPLIGSALGESWVDLSKKFEINTTVPASWNDPELKPGTWKESKPGKFPEEFNEVLKQYLIKVPKSVTTRKSLVLPRSIDRLKLYPSTAERFLLIIVHGTWAGETQAFFERSNKVYQAFRNYAEYYATKNKGNIDVISWKWEGFNTDKARLSAGQSLAVFINDMYRLGYKKIIIFSHSHGGNVVNHASTGVIFPIEQSIQFATPIIDYETSPYVPFNIKELNLFYSTGDIVQIGGRYRYSKGAWATNTSKSWRKYDVASLKRINPNMKIRNIRVQIDKQDPDHSRTMLAVFGLTEILETIDTYFNGYSDFDVAIALNDKEDGLDKAKLKPNGVAVTLRNPGPLNELPEKVRDEQIKGEEAFKLAYPLFNIHEKGKIFGRTQSTLWNLYATAQGMD